MPSIVTLVSGLASTPHSEAILLANLDGSCSINSRLQVAPPLLSRPIQPASLVALPLAPMLELAIPTLTPTLGRPNTSLRPFINDLSFRSLINKLPIVLI